MFKTFFVALSCLMIGCQASNAGASASRQPKRRVIILCTGNSSRSQMAEALWKKYGGNQWEAVSAGTHPKDRVYPLAVKAMAEKGLDISANKPKDVKEYTEQHFDLVITVCGDAERECPHFANATEHLHWPFDDPPKATGTDDDRLRVCRRVRDQIESKIRAYLADQPH